MERKSNGMWDRVGWMETLVLPEVGPWMACMRRR